VYLLSADIFCVLFSNSIIQGGSKNVPLYFCLYLCQLLTDFHKFFYWYTVQRICDNVIIIDATIL